MAAPRGNCFSTCLACILELDPSNVPNFVGEFPGTWLEKTLEWLEPMNLGAMFLAPNSMVRPPGYSIMGVELADSPQPHCVVALDGEVVWDPSPIPRKILTYACTFVILSILDPAKQVNKGVYFV